MTLKIFNLVCANNHQFEGWFRSLQDYESQKRNKQVACPVCDCTTIERQASAPHINIKKSPTSRNRHTESSVDSAKNLTAERITKSIVDYVIKNTEDVGGDFPNEARKIFYNETPTRPIRGNASKAEIKELKDEGIEVLPLPGIAPTKTSH